MLAEGLTKVALLLVLARVAPLPPALRSVSIGLAIGVTVLLSLVMAAAWSHAAVRCLPSRISRIRPAKPRFSASTT